MKSQDRAGRPSITLWVAVVTLAAAPVLHAVPPTLQFSATISPTSVNAGATDLYTITITNLGTGSGGSANLGSAKVVVPGGFTIVSALTVTPPSGKSWSGSLVSGEIQLTEVGAASNKLLNGESVSVTFSATAPTPSSTTVYTWTAAAWNDKDFTGDGFAPPDPQPAVTVIPLLSYVFAGWRPPVNLHLDDDWDGWESGSTMPVKFLVVDNSGAPATSGVVANVQIGGSDVVAAVLDDATTGQWKAEITLVGSGAQAVTIAGNVTGVTPLEIQVKP